MLSTVRLLRISFPFGKDEATSGISRQGLRFGSYIALLKAARCDSLKAMSFFFRKEEMPQLYVTTEAFF